MRTYKHRAKALDNGCWVYGYYWSNDLGNHFIKVTRDINGFCLYDVEVDPETVGEFTENKDKNETEIYENQWIKFKLPKESYWAGEENQNPTGQVIYEPDKGGFIVKFREHGLNQPYVLFNCDIACECEVVDTIHDQEVGDESDLS